LIYYKTKNGTLAMKKHYEHSNIFKCMLVRLYDDDILLKQMPLRNKAPRFKKLSFQNLFLHFSIILQHIKNQMKNIKLSLMILC